MCRILLLAVFLMGCALPSLAKTYTVISYLPANPPYNIQLNGPQGTAHLSGIFVDLFKAISKHTGDRFVMVEMPVARGTQRI